MRSLLVRLLLAYLLPTLALFGLFGFLAYRVTERSLEDSLGQLLTGIAEAAATQIRADTVLFLSPGDDESRTAARLHHKLRQLRERTRVARVLIIDRALRSRSDTQAAMRIGDRYYHAEADRSELGRVFGEKRAASSVLFVGGDGQTYKTGYAPIVDDRGTVVAALGVEGSAGFYVTLARLRNYLLLSGGIVGVLVALTSLFVARRITRPLRLLAREAARIGAGELEREVAVVSRDEVGLLAATMNEMREGLYQRDQHMQMMLSGIAHEVRNPLGGIELFSGLLREELADDRDKLQHVARIERELSYLKKVVVDFLDYARRAAPAVAEVDLAALARETAEVLAKEALERGVELRAEPDGRLEARGDPEQLRRVLVNLVRNALQATPAGGRVVLRCLASDDGPACEVSDTGRGIAAEHLPRIFTPFFTTREKGTGLGLALAKKIVDDHGGTLTVSSEPGGGSTFRVTLPRGERDDGQDPDHR